MKIVIAEFMDDASVAALKTAFDTTYDPSLVDRRQDLLHALSDANALIVRNRTQVDFALLECGPRLEVVGRLGVGLDNIDTDTCRSRNIAVIPATGANARAVAEYVIGTSMILLRQAYLHGVHTARGEWPRNRFSNGREVHGKLLGLVGFGGIGQLTEQLAQGLGVTVIANDPMIAADAAVWREANVVCASFDEVLARSDIVSLHVPLTEETRGLIDERALSRMKPGAVLVNSARGGIVDETALADALRSGHLGGAALDVFDQEPLSAANVFDGVPRLILTPHIAGVTTESNIRVSALIAGRVIEYLKRSPANL